MEKAAINQNLVSEKNAPPPDKAKKMNLQDFISSDLAKVLLTLFLLILLFAITFFLSFVTAQRRQPPAGAEIVPEAEITFPGPSQTPGESGKSQVGPGCAVGGCSSELCLEESQKDKVVSTCILRPEYVCYKTATCEKQANGRCGWTQSQELVSCLSQY